MICEILAVGTELLMGQVANTDAQYISRKLSAIGISVYHHTVVGDNVERLKEALKLALSRADIVITTGGLGPTEDDLTKETVAEYFGLPLEMDAPSLEFIRQYLKNIDKPMTDNNIKQALIPKGATIMPNRYGTAPGCIVREGGKLVAVLPGPPRELTYMFDNELEGVLAAMNRTRFQSKYLHIFGVGESVVETRLLDLFPSENPTLALYCGAGEVTARITASGEEGADLSALIAPMEAEINRRLGDAVYGEGLDVNLQNTVVRLLAERGAHVALAESLTGGMIAAKLVDVPGASHVFEEGFVTYSDAAKERLLGVSAGTLAREGAVSEACAQEMARGAQQRTGADFAVAVTGVAGPDGGTKEKPVGLVYFAVADKAGVRSYTKHFNGTRANVRTYTCAYALDYLRRAILGL